MHINVKPLDRNQVYETADQAIQHVILNKLSAYSLWNGSSFGRDIANIRKVQSAISSKNAAAFVAYKRRGFWRVELAE